jgi:hypothetical protein
MERSRGLEFGERAAQNNDNAVRGASLSRPIAPDASLFGISG